MAATIYLAMTAAEFSSVKHLPPRIGWMACHFSPYGRGLSNLPSALPPGSLLIINDRIPFCHHDPVCIASQLVQAADTLGFDAVLLDFQKPEVTGQQALADHLAATLPRPVILSELYAKECSCPVFLPPCPHHTHLQEYLAPWQGRELWLDLAVDAETITLTKDGSSILPLPLGELPENGYAETALHCHYRTETGSDFAKFTLWRTKEDLELLAQEAEVLGIQSFVGLYQEWN